MSIRTVSHHPHKAIVIHSPHSGRSHLLTQALAALQENSIALAGDISIADLDALPRQGDYWKRSGIDLAIAAGGDGVVGGVITHIADSDLPLGILPLGTANDIARSLRIPQDITEAVQVLTSGTILDIDIGKAEPAAQAPHRASHDQKRPAPQQISARQQGYFAHALTTGLNVQFARLATNMATRKRFGRLTYPLSALDVLFNHTAIDMQIRLSGLALAAPNQNTNLHSHLLQEDVVLSSHALQVTIINAPIFGGQWNFAIPKAALDDRLLDVVLIDDIGLQNPLATFTQWFNHPPDARAIQGIQPVQHSQIQAAELSRIPGIHHVQARSATITTAIDPQDVTLDGEVRGQTPISIAIAAKRLPVLVPQATPAKGQ